MKGFFEEIRKAVSDFTFYKEVKRMPVSRAIKYLLALLLVTTVLLSLRLTVDMNRGLGVASRWMDENLPVITIAEGEVEVDVKQPFILEEEGFVLIIDTTGQISNLDDYEQGLLLTKNSVLYRESDVKTESYSLKDIRALTLDSQFVRGFQKSLPFVVFPLMVILIYIYFFIARLLQILIFSLASLVIASITRNELSYKEIVVIGVFALTPSTLLGALFPILGIQIPFFNILYSGIYVIMLVMAITNCKESEVSEEMSE